MKKAKAKKTVKPEEKDEEITNPFYGITMQEAVDRIVKAGKPKKNNKEEGK